MLTLNLENFDGQCPRSHFGQGPLPHTLPKAPTLKLTALPLLCTAALNFLLANLHDHYRLGGSPKELPRKAVGTAREGFSNMPTNSVRTLMVTD